MFEQSTSYSLGLTLLQKSLAVVLALRDALFSTFSSVQLDDERPERSESTF
jgi:hypothetical protein